jgi:glutamine amidotransferase
MCELFAVTAKRKITVNDTLKTFYSHSEEHKNGWGLYLKDDTFEIIVKEYLKASDSTYLHALLDQKLETKLCIGHIRSATVGEVSDNNSHPFTGIDKFGRQWVLCHNGTLFDAPVLDKYYYVQDGSTDSERLLLYLIERVNSMDVADAEDRMRLIEHVIAKVVPGNKLNLMLYDGQYLYVHKNEPGTLYMRKIEDGIMFATHPLDDGHWMEFPTNCLQVYKEGDLVYEGRRHDYTYIYDPEKMKAIFMAYANL